MPRVVIATLEEAAAHLREWGALAVVDTSIPKGRRTLARQREALEGAITARLRGRLRAPADALGRSVAACRVEAVLRLLDDFSIDSATVVRAEFAIRSGPKARFEWVERAMGRQVSRAEYRRLLDHGLVFVAARLRPVRSPDPAPTTATEQPACSTAQSSDAP